MSNAKQMAKLVGVIDGGREEVINLQRSLVAIPALAPESEGDGEKAKADFMRSWLEKAEFDELIELNAPDPRVSCGYRPNMLCRLLGEERSRTVWVLAHLDVVPAGDLKKWKSKPFELKLEGDELFGRGTEINP